MLVFYKPSKHNLNQKWNKTTQKVTVPHCTQSSPYFFSGVSQQRPTGYSSLFVKHIFT